MWWKKSTQTASLLTDPFAEERAKVVHEFRWSFGVTVLPDHQEKAIQKARLVSAFIKLLLVHLCTGLSIRGLYVASERMHAKMTANWIGEILLAFLLGMIAAAFIHAVWRTFLGSRLLSQFAVLGRLTELAIHPSSFTMILLRFQQTASRSVSVKLDLISLTQRLLSLFVAYHFNTSARACLIDLVILFFLNIMWMNATRTVMLNDASFGDSSDALLRRKRPGYVRLVWNGTNRLDLP